MLAMRSLPAGKAASSGGSLHGEGLRGVDVTDGDGQGIGGIGGLGKSVKTKETRNHELYLFFFSRP